MGNPLPSQSVGLKGAPLVSEHKSPTFLTGHSFELGALVPKVISKREETNAFAKRKDLFRVTSRSSLASNISSKRLCSSVLGRGIVCSSRVFSPIRCRLVVP